MGEEMADIEEIFSILVIDEAFDNEIDSPDYFTPAMGETNSHFQQEYL